MVFEGKRFLVTGGTGSFGNFVVHELLQRGAAEVRVLSRDEKKQYDMRVIYGHLPELTFIIGDVRNRRTVSDAMIGVDSVFHAAALKQVPSCEHFPGEAIQTNIEGAKLVAESAIEQGIKSVVSISTDKAVKPVNVMGMTKALQERLMVAGNLSRKNKGTRLVCVRYGNVLRSRGSVLPFFRRFLSMGKTLPITDLRMTRFLLTLKEAIDLVLYAAEYGKGGEIFVRKASSTRILDLARVLSEEAGKPFKHEVIGKYPGEKIHEILISEEELERTQDEGEYYRINPWWDKTQYSECVAEYSSSTEPASDDEIRRMIRKADREFEELGIGGGEFALF